MSSRPLCEDCGEYGHRCKCDTESFRKYKESTQPKTLAEKELQTDREITMLKEKLSAYENPNNWIRGYDWHGNLIDEFAVFRPKLKRT
jgi:hypothetical protein